MAASLLAACIMDIQSSMVYDYVWWLGGAAGGLLMGGMILAWRRNGVQGYEGINAVGERLGMSSAQLELLGSVIIFILVQELLFSKFYGRADCHAFSVCALAEGAVGMGMKEYLVHMLLAFGVLAVVQLLRGNVGRDGNLKNPVPFLPYITITFWINHVIFLLICVEIKICV